MSITTYCLIDDGTLDTVLECTDCGEEFRFSEVERDENGDILDGEWARIVADLDSEHACDTPDGF